MFVAWGPLLAVAGGFLGVLGFGPGWPGLVLALLCGLVGLAGDAGLLEKAAGACLGGRCGSWR